MRAILRESNDCLLGEVERLERALATASPAAELLPYYKWVVTTCAALRQQVLDNFGDLDLNRDDILPDILSKTQQLTRTLSVYNQRLSSPILRSMPSDRLCLRILGWLHESHPSTQNVPVGLSDGEFGIWPAPPFPVVYFMPSSAQQGLLYLPLFFHEFGHILYACHRQRMDGLVRALQEELIDLLQPVSARNDLYAQAEEERLNKIVESWYTWAQELFCDAVGLSIGGPCFLKAFSAYFRMVGRGQFHLPRDELAGASHPVTWIRITLLSAKARQTRWSEDGDHLENEWQTIGRAMSVSSDYYGFYAERFAAPIRNAIEAMIAEVRPYHAGEDDVAPSEWDPERSTPVHLLNRAWSHFLSDPEGYDAWEKKAVEAFLTTDKG